MSCQSPRGILFTLIILMTVAIAVDHNPTLTDCLAILEGPAITEIGLEPGRLAIPNSLFCEYEKE